MHRDPLIHASQIELPSVCQGYTRFVLISDTHGATFDVPDGDVLIHCGDLTRWDRDCSILQKSISWLRDLPHKHKIVIAGNHDYCLDPTRHDVTEESRIFAMELVAGCDTRDAGITYLCNESAKIAVGQTQWTIWGSPYTEDFTDHNGCKAFSKLGEDMPAVWSKIPQDTDIVVTHTLPHGILDVGLRGNVGCPHLGQQVQSIGPKLHAFGHVHSSRGIQQESRTLFVNAACSNNSMTEIGSDGLGAIVVDLPNPSASWSW